MAKAQGAIGTLKTAFDRVWTTLVANLAPVIELVASKLTSAFKTLGPLIDWVGRAFSTHWGFIADIVGEVVDVVWDVIKSVGQWVSDLLGLGDTSVKVEEVVTKVWKGIATGAAYVWDVIKAGAGIVAIVAGQIIGYFNPIIVQLSAIASIAKALPDDLRPTWVDGMVDGIEKVKNGLREAGDGMTAWGKGTLDSFGKSAQQVDAWFDKRKKDKDAALKGAAGMKSDQKSSFKIDYTKNDALTKGTAEAVSAEIKYKTQAFLNTKPVDKEQLDELKQIKKGIGEVVGALGGGLALVKG